MNGIEIIIIMLAIPMLMVVGFIVDTLRMMSSDRDADHE